MKKSIRNIILGVTCASMLFAFTGCNPEDGGDDGDDIELIHSDTETRPVALAIGALDQNFNPFFYTSGNDGEVIGMTQISMLTADANGHIVCGDDQATMVRDYSVTSYTDANETNVSSGSETIDHTTYKFVIKNGVKDSMGNAMDIVDVLFNLYVYLDPMYTGSSTIYSTKIQGLNAYRAQQEVDDTFDYEAEYRPYAQARFDNILGYDSIDRDPSIDVVKEDLKIVYNLFKESLNSDWNSVVGTLNTYPEYRFTEDWELFMLNEGMIGYQYRYVNNIRTRYTDANGKYYTTLDPEQPGSISYNDQTNLVDVMNDALEGLEGVARAQKMQETAVSLVLDKYFAERPDSDGSTYYISKGTGMVTELLTQWTVGGDVMSALLRDEMTNRADKEEDGSLKIKSISGITVEEDVTSFNGVMGVDLEGEKHDVLVIKINGVDPAAIYNFAFTVAPMDYYSGTYKDKNYVSYARQNWNDPNASDRFGVCFMDTEFMEKVVGGKSVPVGAGAYKMKEGESQFYDGSMVRYERNTNFTTLGSGIENAKIKYLNYVYTTDDQIVNSLIKKTIDYGQPNCTPTNIQQLTNEKHLFMRNYDANGFGYVGINPTFVPDRGVRIAIMLAMNPQNYVINNYYTKDYSSPIYRPTSTTNFLNDYDTTGSLTSSYEFRQNDESNPLIEGTKLEWTDDDAKLIGLVTASGWDNSSGKFMKDGKELALTFTIAGETTDHPAWQMFTQAAAQLNRIGFNITVKNDRNALVKLATGKLEVWAAAWSTGIDPDMYQIYHKDSNASSTKNWGYDTIMNNADKFAVENSLLTHLSNQIDLARSTTVERYRTEYYVNALNDVMEMAVELPTYQRHDLGVYNRQIIKSTSLNSNPSANAGLLYKVWELDYN